MQGIAALMALNSMELEEKLAEMQWGSTRHMHAAIESMRLGFVDALQYNADPEVHPSDNLGFRYPEAHSHDTLDFTLRIAMASYACSNIDAKTVLSGGLRKGCSLSIEELCDRWCPSPQMTFSARSTPRSGEKSCSDLIRCSSI